MAKKPQIRSRNLEALLNADADLLTADLDKMSDITSSLAELNYLDITTLGTGAASKAVVLDAGEDYVWPATGILTYGVLKDPAGTTITATGAEINYLDTSAVGTITAGKVMTVDANYQVGGWRRKSVSVDGGNINIAMTGGVIDNDPSGSAAMFNLPAAAVGMEFYFYVLEAQELRINPDGTETIGLPSSGVQQAGGKYISADAVGEYVHILCVKAGQWETLDYRGTWSVEG